MSIPAISWAYSQRLSAIPKMILIVLADHHNGETGQCNPSVKRICEMAGVVQRTVENHIETLEHAGLVIVEKRYRDDGSRTSNQYRLSLDGGFNSPGGEPTPPPGALHSPPGEPTSLLEPGREPGIEPGEKPPFIPPLAQKRDTQITESFRAAMRQRFSSPLGATVDERIDEALGHKARLKYTDLQQYVQGWLRRDAERASATGPPGNGSSNRSRRQTIHERMMEVERATPPLRQPIRP